MRGVGGGNLAMGSCRAKTQQGEGVLLLAKPYL